MIKNFSASSLPPPIYYESAEQDSPPIKIGLLFTGGGSQGAFGGGVAEALLDPTHPNSISKYITHLTGTSAGIINAVAIGSGLNNSGAEEAVSRVRKIWTDVSSHGFLYGRHLRFFSDALLPQKMKWPNIPRLPFNPMEIFQSFMPSYTAQFISKLIKGVVKNWNTEVQNGPVKITANTILEDNKSPGTFEHVLLSGKDLTPDGVAASANLKQFGIHYIGDSENAALRGRRAYDGAYHENGPMQPHLDAGVTDIIMIILHDRRHGTLDKAGALKHAEIHTNALDLAVQDAHNPVFLHAVELEILEGEIGDLAHIDDSSKMNTDPEFIQLLYQAGLNAGRDWLSKNADYIGQRSSYTLYTPALEQFAELNVT